MSIFNRVLKFFFGDPADKLIKSFQPLVAQINDWEPTYHAKTDDELRQVTEQLKERLKQGAEIDDLLPEAFALVREAAKRTVNMRHFDVQLIGGIVLHQGKIAEMKTGEGKTLVATLPAFLNALAGKGVYIVTVNDYLAKRDSEWMGQVYKFLGLRVGLIQSNMPTQARQQAYQSDITYGTNNEFGFDYLRDNLAWDLDQCCQTRRHFALIDEVDSILIDEARTPLIISGPLRDSTAKYVKVAKMVKSLQKETHFTLDEKHRNVVLTEEGNNKIEKDMGLENIFSLKNMDVAHMAIQCLRAFHLYKRDVDYVVKDNQVLIVDEFTGRILDGRRYSDGLHQAIEAVENLPIQNESQTLASITYQNYFRMFPKLAGMTGTAATEAAEFEKIYGLSVITIPTNNPMIRLDSADLVYKSKEEKYKAIIQQIKELHKAGQPVLVGTIAIETSEMLSSYLSRAGVPHNVLNAKQHEREAEIIAKAGQKGAVTIATNMAGRGTDIVLGDGVKELGGLFILGSERHESRRIDNQLRGRAGRQGDPGGSRFYVALNDELMRLFGSDRIAKMMETLGLPADTPIEHPWISKSIERAQSKVERYHFSMRKQVLEYDDVMNKQRTTVYALRHNVLAKVRLDEKINEMITEVIKDQHLAIFGEQGYKNADEVLKQSFIQKLQSIFPIQNMGELFNQHSKDNNLLASLAEAFMGFYQFRRQGYPEGIFDELVTKRTILYLLDKKWMDHLHNMDVLREGIGLRAWGQRDPLVEYKIEGFDMFQEMLASLAEEALEMINKSEIVRQDEELPVEPVLAPEQLVYNSSAGSATQPSRKQTDDAGRNAPCPCGSGKKYKKCCMK